MESSVEEMKLLPTEMFLDLFAGEKFIVKQKAKLAFDELAVENFNFARCAKNIPLVVGGSPSCSISATSTLKTPTLSSRALRDNKLGPKLTTFPMFSCTMIKTKEKKKLEREERNGKKKRQQECRTPAALNDNHKPSRAESDSDGH